jgi:hypothetical protein
MDLRVYVTTKELATTLDISTTSVLKLLKNLKPVREHGTFYFLRSEVEHVLKPFLERNATRCVNTLYHYFDVKAMDIRAELIAMGYPKDFKLQPKTRILREDYDVLQAIFTHDERQKPKPRWVPAGPSILECPQKNTQESA